MSKIATKWIEDQAVTEDKLNASVPGDGLQGAAGSPLSIKPDSTTGVTVAPLSVGANGAGAAVDNVTVDHASGTLGVKDGGIDTTQLADGGVTNVKLAGSITDDKLAETYIKADGTVAFTGDQSMGSNKLTSVANGTDPNDAVNLSQLDNAVTGISWREPVDEQATSPSGNETGNDGWRVLINGTGSGAFSGHDNEIAVWDDVGSSWSFESPSANWAVFDKATDNAYTYNADTTAWIQFSGAGQVNAGAGLSKSGNTINVGENNTGGINVNADDIALNPDGSTIEVNGTGPGTVRVKPDGIGANELDETDSYDFSPSGSVDVSTAAPGTNTTQAASTAFVQQEISGLTSENVKQYMHKITSGEVTAGYFTLPTNPVNAQSVFAKAVKGPGQVNKQVVGATGATPDFDILNTNEFHFNNNGAATGLSAHFGQNDIVIVNYHD